MKIPFLLSLLAALITGLISITGNASTNQTCIRMIIAIVAFYVIGVFISSTITSIVEEQNKIKEEAEKKLQEEEALKRAKERKHTKEDHLGVNLDLVTDTSLDDEFSPLDLSQAIRTKVKE